jgi:hypothetical protein
MKAFTSQIASLAKALIGNRKTNQGCFRKFLAESDDDGFWPSTWESVGNGWTVRVQLSVREVQVLADEVHLLFLR